MLVLLIGVMTAPNPADAAGRRIWNSQRAAGEEEPAKRENPERAITRLIRQMQMDLEGSSSRGFLGNINSAKFDDYPRFEDMIERLTRENILRVYFRQVSNSIQGDNAQTIIDAELEMARKNSPPGYKGAASRWSSTLNEPAEAGKLLILHPADFLAPYSSDGNARTGLPIAIPGPARLQRRRQQVVIDFERTSRGWKIINITPRGFFSPL